jgi:hypothetical protein
LLDELVAASAFFLAASAALFLASSSAHSLALSLCSSIDSGGGDAMPLILVLPFLACTGDGLVSFRFIVPDLTSFFDVRWKIHHSSTNFKLLTRGTLFQRLSSHTQYQNRTNRSNSRTFPHVFEY